MRSFFDALKAFIPTGVDIKVQRTYQVIEASNGVLQSEGQLASDLSLIHISEPTRPY